MIGLTESIELVDGRRCRVFRDSKGDIRGTAAADAPQEPVVPVVNTAVNAILSVDPAKATTEDVMTALQWLVKRLRTY